MLDNEIIFSKRLIMIYESILNIVDAVDFKKRDDLISFLQNCICKFDRKEEEDRESTRPFESVVFKLDYFYKHFSKFHNEFGKDKVYVAAVTILIAIADEIKIELDKYDLFILYHLRNQGKFRLREDKLLEELKKLWALPQYKEYAINNNQDFAASIRALRDTKAINYRRGNMTLNPSIIIRYR